VLRQTTAISSSFQMGSRSGEMYRL
jgi:hypothetical protein